ncbi:hypothetical protein VTN49DRAFT_6869 [Thermomyces lanuginosus]|uniref:uncharacterized protein n=1 Tax=Thermomyces lanuginosus TaxID=5541 RepID=UPI003741F2C8
MNPVDAGLCGILDDQSQSWIPTSIVSVQDRTPVKIATIMKIRMNQISVLLSQAYGITEERPELEFEAKKGSLSFVANVCQRHSVESTRGVKGPLQGDESGSCTHDRTDE